jgi:hypothetical protein
MLWSKIDRGIAERSVSGEARSSAPFTCSRNLMRNIKPCIGLIALPRAAYHQTTIQ